MNDASVIITILDLVAVELFVAASFSVYAVISMEFSISSIAGFSSD